MTFAVAGIEPSDIVFAEIGVPRHSLRIHDDVVRLDDRPRKVVFRDDDLRVFPLGSRECLERIRPCRAGAQIDRAEEFGHPLPGLPERLAARLEQPSGRSFLHVQRKTRICIRRHPLQHFHHLSRVVLGFDDAFERVADDTREQRGLLIVGARHARQPLRIRELGGEVFRLVQGEIGGDSRVRRHVGDAGILHLVSHGADAERILTRRQPVPRKAVLPAGIADDADGDGGPGFLRADHHTFHEAFGGGADLARQRDRVLLRETPDIRGGQNEHDCESSHARQENPCSHDEPPLP